MEFGFGHLEGEGIVAGNGLTHQVTHYLGFSIVNGNISSCKKIPSEIELAVLLGVSRSVIREAVKILHAKGLIVSNSKTGISLMPPSEWSLFDNKVLEWISASSNSHNYLWELFSLANAVIPAAARLAASNFGGLNKNDIYSAVIKIEINSHENRCTAEAEADFYFGLFVASKNPYFLQMQKIVKTLCLIKNSLSNRLGVMAAAEPDFFRDLYFRMSAGESSEAVLCANKILFDMEGIISAIIEKATVSINV